MKNIRQKLKQIRSAIDDFLDSGDEVIVLPYRGFASQKRIFLKGRVLEKEKIKSRKDQSLIDNLKDTFRRFESDEVEGAKVRITIDGQAFDAISDDEGYFVIDQSWTPAQEGQRKEWQEASVQLKSETGSETTFQITGEILVPSANSDFGIITDIDDTVLQTHVTSKLGWKMIKATFLENVHDRLPMEGIPDLLQEMNKGGDGKQNNPVFYLSNSPWNVYDLLIEFLRLNDLPKGPVLLRDYGFHLLKKKEKEETHKWFYLEKVFTTYPELSFVLLGDTASEDADLYLKAAKAFPGRVKAIYIRQTGDTKNARRVAKLINEKTGAVIRLVNNSGEIRAHAVKAGLIRE